MARVNYSGYFFALIFSKNRSLIRILAMHGEENDIKYISKPINEWTDDIVRIAIIFEERENLKSEKFPDEKFGQSFLTLK